jgi:hypothetical protein
MLQWERYHDNELCWLKRPDGFTGTASPTFEFCLLLVADPGTDDKTLQLVADPGTDDHCLELVTSTM